MLTRVWVHLLARVGALCAASLPACLVANLADPWCAEINNTASIKPTTKPSNNTATNTTKTTTTTTPTTTTTTKTTGNSSADGSSVLASRAGSGDQRSMIEPAEGSTNVTLMRANAAAGVGLGSSQAGLLAVALLVLLWAL